MLAVGLAVALLEQVGDDQELAHRLGRVARLGDDVKAGLVQIQQVEQAHHALGIDVVLDVELGAGALAAALLVVAQVVHRLLHHRRAQRGAADAQHHEVVELLADLLCSLVDVGHDLRLVVGQLGPHHHLVDGAAGALHGLVRGGQLVGQLGQVAGLDKVLLEQAARRVGELGDGGLDLIQLLALEGVRSLAQVGAHRGAGVGGEVRHHVVEVKGQLHGRLPVFTEVMFGHTIDLTTIEFTGNIIDSFCVKFHHFLTDEREYASNSLFFNKDVLG